MKLKHIFFDLDHTLWDFEKNSNLTFIKIFDLNNININVKHFLIEYIPINLAYWRLYREDRIDKESLRYARLKDTFDALNYTISDELINKLSDDYILYLSDFNHLFKDTIEVLDYLKDKYSLHIITNGFHEIQHKKMISSKIIHYFNYIFTSESVGVKKPNSKIFLHALEISGAKKENSLMIGDSLEADVYGAQNVGIEAIHCCFDTLTSTDKNVKTVKSLKQLMSIL